MGLRFLIAAVLAGMPLASPAEIVRVAPGPQTLSAAIAAAQPGDTLMLEPGDYAGPVIIDRSLVIDGNGAHVAGPDEGSVITVTAPDVTLRGLTVTGAGKRLDLLDGGIVLSREAHRALVEGNEILGNLIGVDVQGAHDVTVRDNLIIGRDDLRVPERGPGIYVWNAPGLLVEGNSISKGRDGIFITSSNRATYRDNELSDLRYAIHSMYSNELVVEDNISHDNDMGFAFMYSTRVQARGNLSMRDVTHAFFMNFVNRSVFEANEVREGGEKCLFVYNSNRNSLQNNRFAGCDIGVHFTAGSEGNLIAGNAFVGNRTQVKYVGSRWLEWSDGGRGNYWSDHAGFDIDGDGMTDSPYRPNDVIDQVIWSQPMARLLTGAPAMQLVSWSQARFPGLLPGGVIDSHPLTKPGPSGNEARSTSKESAQ